MSNKSLLVVSSCLVIVVSALLYLRLTDESATSTQGTESTQTADAQPEKLTEEQAIELVKALPDVAQWIAAVEANDDADSQPIFDANLDADGNYSVHAFEAFSDHTATFNWFTVDPESKKITEMFSTSDNDRQVELSTGSVSLVPYAVETLSFL
ncbi:MAG TPA: hypothetical protein PKL83_06185, partial [bacterium]|nr:hypothetical protein [bacterium]